MNQMLVVAALVLVSQDDPALQGLRDADIEVRQRAEDALVARGEAGVAALEALAARETDGEVRGRLRRAIDRITKLEFSADLEGSLKRAAAAGKRLFVVAAPEGIGGPT